jgi:integrase
MARTVRDANLETRTARGRLKAAGKPYWRAIDEGLHVGYRKGVAAGKWCARYYQGDGKYETETLAAADDTLDADGDVILTFGQAQALARSRFLDRQRAAAGIVPAAGPYTVKDAITDYLAFLEHNRKSAQDTKWRADALILPRLGDVECAKLTTQQIRDWRDALAAQPARRRTKPGKAQAFAAPAADIDPDEARRKRHASANRTLTILKAALNHAWREKKVASDDAWRRVQPFREADAARVRYLTVAEAQRLINAAQGNFRPLVQAALLTGARFSELAALTVSDFNPDAGTLHIRTSKSGKARHVVLTEEGAAFFAALCAGRPGVERMLWRTPGNRWTKSSQSRPMAEACRAARIEPPASFHTTRHTYASLSVMNGAPLMVIARNLGHADTRMVEKHYGHLSQTYVAEAIRAAAPRFGITGGNVVAIGR